jgi:flagellar biosynthesis protein FlhB
MAENDSGEKTEAPTPRRRQEARDAGNIARSPDLNAACLMLGILLLLRSFGPPIVSALRLVVSDLLSVGSLSDLDAMSTISQVFRAFVAVGVAMTPLFVGIMLLAILVNMSQVGLYFNVGRLQPNWAALNPVRGWSRLFSGKRTLVRLGMSFIKVIFVALTAYSAIHGRLEQIITAQSLGFLQIFYLGSQIIFSITLRIGILLVCLSIFDYAYQRYQLEQDLKMTKQEIKDEMRRMDGDPKIKQRRRQITLERYKKWLKKEVPKADVVITNPTHYSVALKYDPANMHAPRVIAKGQDIMARRIREIAVECGIPIVERPPLARALYRMCKIGDEIPEEFYSAVAEIIAYVYRLAGKESELMKAGKATAA